MLWPFKKKIPCQSAFTLIETLVTLGILSVVAMVTTVSFVKILPDMRIRNVSRDIQSTMLYAKSESIKRGENVTVLFNSVTPGYSIFLDMDSDKSIDPGETLLFNSTTFPDNISFDPDNGGDGITFPGNALVFTFRGLPENPGSIGIRATNLAGNITRKRNFTVSIAGRIEIDSL